MKKIQTLLLVLTPILTMSVDCCHIDEECPEGYYLENGDCIQLDTTQTQGSRLSPDTLYIEWEVLSPMPVPVGYAGFSTYNDQLYIVGGITNDALIRNQLMSFDPGTGLWEQTYASLKSNRWGLTATWINDKLYVMGGTNDPKGEALEDIEVYDPETNVWSIAGQMQTPRIGHAAVAYQGKIYVMGGEPKEPTLSGLYPFLEVYDPVENTWESLSPMPTGRAYLAACVSNDRIYAIGGGKKYPFPGLKTVEEYDPETDTWQTKTELHTGKISAVTCTSGDKIYIIGGAEFNYTPGTTTVEAYDPVKDSMYIASEFNYFRYSNSALLINNKIFLAGGCVSSDYKEFTDVVEAGTITSMDK